MKNHLMLQTSTKFLEHAAMKIPVISTHYFWISEPFRERYGGNYFCVEERSYRTMSWDRITRFPF